MLPVKGVCEAVHDNWTCGGYQVSVELRLFLDSNVSGHEEAGTVFYNHIELFI